MSWSVSFAKEADSFLKKDRRISDEDLIKLVRGAIKKFRGESSTVNIKKLRGSWDGFYRIRKGNLRIIAEFNFEKRIVFVERIDWRGGVYK